MKKLVTLALLIGALFTVSFVNTGCVRLAPGGVYKGDIGLYQAEMTITTSYTLIHEFVKWEQDNRGHLSPEVTQAADRIRRGAPQWFASALALRDAYAANPDGGTRDALTSALEVLRAAVVEATKYLTQANITKL